MSVRFGDASPTPSPTPDKRNGPFSLESNSVKGKDKGIRVVTSFLNRDQERERDFENERLAEGMRLLMAARDRVLTLSEQRVSSLSRFGLMFVRWLLISGR